MIDQAFTNEENISEEDPAGMKFYNKNGYIDNLMLFEFRHLFKSNQKYLEMPKY